MELADVFESYLVAYDKDECLTLQMVHGTNQQVQNVVLNERVETDDTVVPRELVVFDSLCRLVVPDADFGRLFGISLEVLVLGGRLNVLVVHFLVVVEGTILTNRNDTFLVPCYCRDGQRGVAVLLLSRIGVHNHQSGAAWVTYVSLLEPHHIRIIERWRVTRQLREPQHRLIE
jgi:hypothetical protein